MQYNATKCSYLFSLGITAAHYISCLFVIQLTASCTHYNDITIYCDYQVHNTLSNMNIPILFKIKILILIIFVCVFTGLKDHIESARALVDLVITRGPSSLNDPYALNDAMIVEASKPHENTE